MIVCMIIVTILEIYKAIRDYCNGPTEEEKNKNAMSSPLSSLVATTNANNDVVDVCPDHPFLKIPFVIQYNVGIPYSLCDRRNN